MSNPSARPILLLCLAVGLTSLGGLQAQADPSAKAADQAAQDAGASDAPEPAAPAQSAPATQPSPEQIDAWLATARALKAEQPALFDGAEGLLVTQVLPDGQGAAAGIRPGDVLIRYGETPLDSGQQLLGLTRETPAEQTVTLRWLRPTSPDAATGAQALEALIQGGRIGLGIRDLAAASEARMQALFDAGREAWHRADYPHALGAFEEGLALARAANHRSWQATFTSAIGVILNDLGRYQEALEHFTQALAIDREIGDRRGEGAGLGNIGNVFTNLGRYREALEHYAQALAISREIGDRSGEGKNLSGIGNVFTNLGRYREAFEHYAQALAISRETGDRSGEGKNLSGIGNVFTNLGRYQEALEHYTQALAISREIGDRRGEGTDLSNIGNVYQKLGRYQEALAHYTQSLAMHREIGDRRGEGANLGNIGIVYADLDRYQDALEHYTQALAIHREIGDRRGEAGNLLKLGALAQDQDDPDAAAAFYRQALALQVDLNEPETLWNLWNNLRQLWQDQSQPGPAIVAGKRAVNSIQDMRAASSGLDQTLQQSFLEDKDFVYLRLADLLLAQDRPAEAQQVLGMLNEQELYDYIQEDDAQDPRTTRAAFNRIEADWNADYDGIAEPLPALGERIAALSRINASALTAEAQAELARLTTERDRASAELERQLGELPEHFAAIDPAQQAEANEALAQAPGNKRALLAALSEQSGQPTGLLQFILPGDKVRLLLTTPDGWHTAVSEVGGDVLAAEVAALRAALTDPYSDPRAPAGALYRRLFGPLAEALDAAAVEVLLIQPQAGLRQVPFAALHDGHQWLVERWALVNDSAASLRSVAPRPGAWRVAALGTSAAQAGTASMPGVRDELEGIVRAGAADADGVLPGSVLLDQDFTRAALQAAVGGDFNVLHIATAFDPMPGTDAAPGLRLGDGERLTPRDLCHLCDLRHLDLVVLSGCNTAIGGPDAAGRARDSLATRLHRQGARTVLASLWAVADKSTSRLLQTFYRRRAAQPDLTKAQALRLAQLDLLRGTLDGRPPAAGCPPAGDPNTPGHRGPLMLHDAGDPQPAADPACRWSHPYYWAPFILIGNGL